MYSRKRTNVRVDGRAFFLVARSLPPGGGHSTTIPCDRPKLAVLYTKAGDKQSSLKSVKNRNLSSRRADIYDSPVPALFLSSTFVAGAG